MLNNITMSTSLLNMSTSRTFGFENSTDGTFVTESMLNETFYINNEPHLNSKEGFPMEAAVVRIFLAVLAVVGNAMTILTIIRNRQLWKPTYFFICNACLYDFVYGSFVAPTYIATRKVIVTSTATEIGCTLKGVLVGVITVGGACSMLLLAIDRVIYIFLPLRYFNLVTDRLSAILITLAGLTSLAFSIGIYWNNLLTIGYSCLPTVYLKRVESITAFTYVVLLATVTLILHFIVGVIAYKQGESSICLARFLTYKLSHQFCKFDYLQTSHQFDWCDCLQIS